jgi:hypothetical protein
MRQSILSILADLPIGFYTQPKSWNSDWHLQRPGCNKAAMHKTEQIGNPEPYIQKD